MNKIVFRATQGLWYNGERIEVDGLIYAIGYESRSLYALEHTALDGGSVLAIRYTSNQIFSFEQNVRIATEREHLIVSDRADELEPALSDFIQREFAKAAPVSIAVDVSAMNRTVMATVLLRIHGQIRPKDRLILLYSPAQYQEPPLELVRSRR